MTQRAHVNEWITQRPGVITAWCRTMLPAHASIEDVVSDVIVEVLARPDRVPDTCDDSDRRLWGVTRNVCARQRRSAIRRGTLSLNEHHGVVWPADADPYDLASLRAARATLPAVVRPVADIVLFGGGSTAEAAAELGLPEPRVRVYVHRSRRHLQLQLQAAEHGWPLEHPWADTTMWCWKCGEAMFIAGYIPGERLKLRCPSCETPDVMDVGRSDRTRKVLAGIRSTRPALTRVGRWTHDHYRDAARRGSSACGLCGSTTELEFLDAHPKVTQFPAIVARCPDCEYASDIDIAMYGIFHSTSQRFWRQHPRMSTDVCEGRFQNDPTWDLVFHAEMGHELRLAIRRTDYAVVDVRET